jgi:hypothetical protein
VNDAIRVQVSRELPRAAQKRKVCCNASSYSARNSLHDLFPIPPLVAYQFRIARWPGFPTHTMVCTPSASALRVDTTHPCSARSHRRHRRYWNPVAARLHSCCHSRRRHALGQAIIAHQHPAPPLAHHRQGHAHCFPLATRSFSRAGTP